MKNKKLISVACILAAIGITSGVYVMKSGLLVAGKKNSISAPIISKDAIAATVLHIPKKPSDRLLLSEKAIDTEDTTPSLFGFESDLMVDNTLTNSYVRKEPIHLQSPYTCLDGIITFRGNNDRDMTSFGTANLLEKKFAKQPLWEVKTGALKKTVGDGNGVWAGSCWTGQPLIVRWPEKIRKAMNLYPDKKAKKDLTEVIYATCDGNIYFLDLDDGTETRDKISLGFPVKGTGSLYPDGTPLYFVGAGDSMGEDCARTFIIDLIQGKIIYEYGYDDEFSKRTDNNHFVAYDSSPLIDTATDTLIQPGENGILYTTKLNTRFNGTTVSIAPETPVKFRYTTTRSRDDGYYLGMESSASLWDHYLYIADNCGDLYCIDLNTMQVIWVQNTVDDTNASPVLEENKKDMTASLYISSSLHFTKDQENKGTLKLEKINAATGELIWQLPYECETVDHISGGMQATALLGKESLSDYVYFAIARVNGLDKGQFLCINKETGKEAWHLNMEYYTWSSPIALYDKDGNGYLVVCDSKGNMYLIDGLTGKLYHKINLSGANIESTPAAFNNMIVIGTKGVSKKAALFGAKGQRIYGIKVE